MGLGSCDSSKSGVGEDPVDPRSGTRHMCLETNVPRLKEGPRWEHVFDYSGSPPYPLPSTSGV